MKVARTSLAGVLVIEPDRFDDSRGFFLETWQRERYEAASIVGNFVQDNHSHSRQGVLRGLHYQMRRPQAKLVTVFRGRIFDVAVDVRRDSPTFGRWAGAELSDTGPRQMYVPPGFAHGFCVLSDLADVHYKVSDFYDPADEAGVAWNDPEIGVAWPIGDPQIAARDAAYPRLRDIPRDRLPSPDGGRT